MKVIKKYIYALVCRQFMGDDNILFVSNSLKVVREWYDMYDKFNEYVEIVKIEYYEVQKQSR